MKRICIVAVLLALVGSLYGQSVTELSKREKARRAALGKNRARVITNEDLAAVRKTPAIIVGNPDTATESEAVIIPSPESGSTGEPVGAVTMVPTVAKDGPPLFKDSEPGSGADAEARLKAANELIDLLTTKMNSLIQESNSLSTMTPKDVLQRQIDETNQKLLRVQDEATKLKAQIDAAKANAPEKR